MKLRRNSREVFSTCIDSFGPSTNLRGRCPVLWRGNRSTGCSRLAPGHRDITRHAICLNPVMLPPGRTPCVGDRPEGVSDLSREWGSFVEVSGRVPEEVRKRHLC